MKVFSSMIISMPGVPTQSLPLLYTGETREPVTYRVPEIKSKEFGVGDFCWLRHQQRTTEWHLSPTEVPHHYPLCGFPRSAHWEGRWYVWEGKAPPPRASSWCLSSLLFILRTRRWRHLCLFKVLIVKETQWQLIRILGGNHEAAFLQRMEDKRSLEHEKGGLEFNALS